MKKLSCTRCKIELRKSLAGRIVIGDTTHGKHLDLCLDCLSGYWRMEENHKLAWRENMREFCSSVKKIETELENEGQDLWESYHDGEK